MAKYNHVFGVSFNDNDGGSSYFMTADGIDDYKRHIAAMGRWRAYLFFARRLLLSLNRIHNFCVTGDEPKWKLLKGWKP